MMRQPLVMGTLIESLSSKKLVELRSIAKSSGVLVNGNKTQVVQRIAHVLTEVKKCSSVLSFDLGYRNLAYCHLTHDATVLDWARVDLELETFHPSTVAPIVRQFIKERVENNIQRADVVIVEQQRSRTNGSFAVLEHTLRVNSVEGMLWSGLYEAAEKIKRSDLSMLPLNRQRVDDAWENEIQNVIEANVSRFSKIKKGTYAKKQAGVLLVQDWLENENFLKVNNQLKDMFKQESKKDDLSDCLLQAVAWYKWLEYRQNYLDLLLKVNTKHHL
ncbi:hypothetical protein G6F37_009568 [Rhizopus arrhizus]|nr:hypothetical protein G6F37_009568 [Rhizopus arrhizus]